MRMKLCKTGVRLDINTGLARFWMDRAYGEKMVFTANDRRIIHLEQRMANVDNLKELAAKERYERIEPSRG